MVKRPTARRWWLAMGALAVSLVVSQSSVALAPSEMRTDYDWIALRPTDASGAPGTPVPASTSTPGPTEAASHVLRPERAPAAVSAPATPRPTPKKVLPVSGTSLSGLASWYAYVPGGAAAGPALRRSLGRGWRGTTVQVCSLHRCIRVRLSDWCQCYRGERRERIIDLDVRSFAALASPGLGVTRVTVH